MSTSITLPPVADIREKLKPLGHAQLQRLATLSGVSFMTLYTIRSGKRKNPGIDTVRQFMVHLHEVERAGNGGA